MADSKWNGDSYPDGAKNLPDNRVGIAENFKYLETELSDDHYWVDDDDTKNGKHKHVAMPQVTSDTAIPAGSDSIMYTKKITDYDVAAATTIDKRIVHYAEHDGTAPDDVTQIRPMSWGTVWAYVVFDPTVVKDFGSGDMTGVVRSSNIEKIEYDENAPAQDPRTWTVTLTTAAPDVNYMIFGSCTKAATRLGGNSESLCVYGYDGADTKVGEFKIQFIAYNGGTIQKSSLSTTQAYVMVML